MKTKTTIIYALIALLMLAVANACYGGQDQKPDKVPVPVIHVTDLYSPAEDPDDHWDLVCQYSLAYQGKIDLRGIVIDYVQDRVLRGERPGRGDPDVAGVAQMNYITGLNIPFAIGSRWSLRSKNLTEELESRDDLGAVRFIHKLLRESDEPVVIHILGTARDVALAGHADPELFAEKCKAIYYNAGLSRNDGSGGEHNAMLDTIAYAAIFELPCPVYWMPCFSVGSTYHRHPEKREELYEDRYDDVVNFETIWKFTHHEIVPHMSEQMQKFFAFVYRNFHEHKKEPFRTDYLRYLLDDKEEDVLRTVDDVVRWMWCTAGFLHGAGLSTDKEGNLVSLGGADDDPWYTFVPAEISAEDRGVTHWSLRSEVGNQFIFRHSGEHEYAEAMKTALKELLAELP